MNKSRIIALCLLFCSCVFLLQASDEIIKKGRALQNAKKYDEAQELYLNALKPGATEDLYIEAASFLGKLQRYEVAETVLEKGLTAYPDSTSLMNLQGLLKHRKGDNEAAIKLFEAVLAKDAENSFAKKWLETVKSGAPVTGSETQSGEDTDSTRSYSPSPSGVYQATSNMSKEEQQKLAVELYKEMMELEKWELDRFIELHKQVIERCPQTDQAEESCWRLSNLYMLGQDPPDFDNVIAVLEHLLKQYPETDLLPDAKNRLMMAYQSTGRMNELVGLYEELFKRDPDPEDDQTFMVRALEFGNALTAVGRGADAALWYQKVLERDNNRNSLEARAARARLGGQ
jgi:tetratricopeptide (TPR) repeat protein